MRRVKPLPARLSSRNSRLWCVLDVGSTRVRVYLVDRTAKALQNEMRNSAVGWTDTDTATILVGWDVPDDIAEGTLLHEIMHVSVWVFGVHLSPGRTVEDDEEEDIVNPLSSAMFSALKGSGLLVFPPRPPLPKRARVQA